MTLSWSQWNRGHPEYRQRNADATWRRGSVFTVAAVGHYKAKRAKLCLSAQLSLPNYSMSVALLLDSKVPGNLIFQAEISSLFFLVLELARPIPVNALDGCLLTQSSVTHVTVPICLDFPSHSEHIQFCVPCSNKSLFFLGLPWLWRHNPQINWRTAEFVAWSHTCTSACTTPTMPVLATSM